MAYGSGCVLLWPGLLLNSNISANSEIVLVAGLT
jgi:hypothetical protein